MVTKETILRQLHSTSNEIAEKFDALYSEEINWVAEELATSYQILMNILNHEDQSKISDADFQSGLLFWTALNTYLSALELFRRGYYKEPNMLMRSVLEIFSAGYDIHLNPQKLETLRKRPNDFDSKQSIKIAKKIHPEIAKIWGQLSSSFSHVSLLHSVPYRTAPFCVGGLFDGKDQNPIICSILPMFTLTLDIFNSVVELVFIKMIPKPRYWTEVSEDSYAYSIPEANTQRGKKLLEKMREALSKTGDLSSVE